MNEDTRKTIKVFFILGAILSACFLIYLITKTVYASIPVTVTSLATDTLVLLTNTSAPPTNTPAPPTNTPYSPTDISIVPTATHHKLIYDGNVNCHSGPGFSFSIIKSIRGEIIEVLAKDSIDFVWLYVKVDGTDSCYVSNNVLKLPLEIVNLLPTTDSLTPRPTFTPPTPMGTATVTPRGSGSSPNQPNYPLTAQAQTQAAQAQTQAAQAQTQAALATAISAAQTQKAQACSAKPTLDISQNGSNLHLSWSTVSGATSYDVSLKVSGGPTQVVKTTSDTKWDSKISHGESKTFSVSAINSCGNKVSSNQVTVSR